MKKLKVTKYQIQREKTGKKLARPIRIAVLADLHGIEYGKDNKVLFETICDQKPDLVIAAGDMIVSSPEEGIHLTGVLELFKQLSHHYPVFYGNGNHEYRTKIFPEIYGDFYQTYKKSLKDMGIIHLEDEKREIVVHGERLVIYGFDLNYRFYQRFSREHLKVEEMRQALGNPDDSGFCILIAHNPVYFDVYEKWGADLTFSGHLHGGMVRLPFLGGVISPQMKLFPKYDKGLFSRSNSNLIVSAGLGSHTVNLRFNNPCELIIADLV